MPPKVTKFFPVKGDERHGVAHSCRQSSVCHCCCLCSHSGMIYQLLEDTWYKHTIRTSWGKINWMQWWLQFIILKKMAQKVREGWYIDHSSDKLLFIILFGNNLLLPQMQCQFPCGKGSSYFWFMRWRGHTQYAQSKDFLEITCLYLGRADFCVS